MEKTIVQRLVDADIILGNTSEDYPAIYWGRKILEDHFITKQPIPPSKLCVVIYDHDTEADDLSAAVMKAKRSDRDDYLGTTAEERRLLSLGISPMQFMHCLMRMVRIAKTEPLDGQNRTSGKIPGARK